ncbi:MAG: CBS domain-containing protein [Pseudomonadota bacterium]
MPSSYQGRTEQDSQAQKSQSQSAASNLRGNASGASIATILAEKGGGIVQIATTAALREAMDMMGQNRIGSVLVVDDGVLKGILSERDVVRHLSEQGATGMETSVGDVMTADPVTCAPADPLIAVMQAMTDGNFRHMPVIDDGAMAGLISIRDVVKHRLIELEYDALRMRQMIVG